MNALGRWPRQYTSVEMGQNLGLKGHGPLQFITSGLGTKTARKMVESKEDRIMTDSKNRLRETSLAVG